VYFKKSPNLGILTILRRRLERYFIHFEHFLVICIISKHREFLLFVHELYKYFSLPCKIEPVVFMFLLPHSSTVCIFVLSCSVM